MYLITYVGYLKDGGSFFRNDYEDRYDKLGKKELDEISADLCKSMNLIGIAIINIQKLPIG